MAKSIRSKSKRSYRRAKRESGVYAVADAARLQRLSVKLQAKLHTDKDGDATLELNTNEEKGNGMEDSKLIVETQEGGDMTVDSPSSKDVTPENKKISTSGRRLSRREAWRLSKGKPLQRKNPEKINRLGVVTAKRKAGRSKRRR